MSHLWRDTITVLENAGEDADGATVDKPTDVRGSSRKLTARERRNAAGDVPASAGVAILKATGYGDTWELEPGDAIAVAGNRMSVLSVAEIRDPRRNRLHHLEVEFA